VPFLELTFTYPATGPVKAHTAHVVGVCLDAAVTPGVVGQVTSVTGPPDGHALAAE
jgi:hypothetical protein